MDKGFHSPANQTRLAEMVHFPVLLKKGKCNVTEAAREADPEFRSLWRRHSVVESAINAIEASPAARSWPRRLQALAALVVGRNLYRLGAFLLAAKANGGERQRANARP